MQYFISYTRSDDQFVLKLATDLKDAGVNVWLDQLDILPGARWDRAVEDALKMSDGMIAVLSSNAVKSENVLDEVSYAMEKGKNVIPVIIDSCEVPLRIARFQRVDLSKNYEKGLQLLVRTLKPPAPVQDISEVSPVVERYDTSPTPARRRQTKMLVLAGVCIAVLILIYILSSKGTDQNGTVSSIADTTGVNAVESANSIDSSAANPETGNNTSETETPPGPSRIPGKTNGEAAKTPGEGILLSENLYEVLYKQSGSSLVLYTKGDPAFIEVDVNQNNLIDPNVDRAYGITPDGTICSAFVLSSNSSTACGVAPSAATVSSQNHYRLFTIPIDELTVNPSSSVIRIQVGFFNSSRGWSYFPTKSKPTDFSSMYSIPIAK